MASESVLYILTLLFPLIGAFRANVQISPSSQSASPPSGEVWPLQTGPPILRDISGTETHTYAITLTAGQYARIVVDQRGLDLTLTINGPDGKEIATLDTLNAAYGPEDFALLADQPGEYRIQIRGLERETQTAQYQISIPALRMPTRVDKLLISAQRYIVEAEELRRQETAEALRRAVQKYRRALELRRETGEAELEALALAGLGDMVGRLGENRKRADYYEQSVSKLRSLGNSGELAVMLLNAASAWSIAGNPQRSLERYFESLRILRSLGDQTIEANVLAGLGVAYVKLGEVETAISYYNQALPLFRKRQSIFNEANVLHNLGISELILENPRKALDYLNQALELRRSSKDRRGEGVTLDGLGRVHVSLDERERALDYFNQALSVRRTLGDQTGQADTLGRLGLVYASFGERQKALDYYSLALGIQERLEDEPGQIRSLTSISRVETERGDFTEARKHLEAALTIVDRLRMNVIDWSLRATYTSTVREAAELYVNVLIRLHQREPSEGYDGLALRASESARARGLLELLTDPRHENRLGVDSRLYERQRSLRSLLDERTRDRVRLLEEKHADEAATAAKEIEKLQRQYDEVDFDVRTGRPGYGSLVGPEALELAAIQRQVLDSESLLLEYVIGESSSFLLAVTSDSVSVHELPKRAAIEAAARNLSELLTARVRRTRFETAEERASRVSKADDEYPKAASALSQTLLGPVARKLEKRRLLIVPDGSLHYVPFSALPTPSNAGSFLPLASDHEVVTLPSASVLAVLRKEIKGRAPPKKVLAVVADPVFSPSDERLAGTATNAGSTPKASPGGTAFARAVQEVGLEDQGRPAIPRLPFTRREAKAILALVPPAARREVLDFDASRSAAMSAELADYRFVHFATHGFLNSRHPELSGLVFSLVDHDGKEQDGFLPALEVFNLKLPVDLVVLSGCRTGLGKDIKGEGLVGLTRGFMYAGAARVLVSLWDVDDEATAELMTRFYQGMLGKRHLTPAAALRAAQLSISKEKRWQAPYYWAAFILQGEPK